MFSGAKSSGAKQAPAPRAGKERATGASSNLDDDFEMIGNGGEEEDFDRTQVEKEVAPGGGTTSGIPVAGRTGGTATMSGSGRNTPSRTSAVERQKVLKETAASKRVAEELQRKLQIEQDKAKRAEERQRREEEKRKKAAEMWQTAQMEMEKRKAQLELKEAELARLKKEGEETLRKQRAVYEAAVEKAQEEARALREALTARRGGVDEPQAGGPSGASGGGAGGEERLEEVPSERGLDEEPVSERTIHPDFLDADVEAMDLHEKLMVNKSFEEMNDESLKSVVLGGADRDSRVIKQMIPLSDEDSPLAGSFMHKTAVAATFGVMYKSRSAHKQGPS